MKKLVLIASVLAVSACGGPPVTKVPVAVGGSKADGNIRMAYDQGAYETVQVDWPAGEANALKRCQAWGYTKVESFAGSTRQCIERGRGIFNGVPVGTCAVWQHFKNYQCLD